MEQTIAGRYRLISRLGRGAMGEVWLAKDLTLGREVAVKVLNLSSPSDPQAAARFRREATATAGLNHPNVVRVFDAGFDDPGEAFMVMELLDGPSLVELTGALEWREAVELVAQVAAGLGAAHAVGVIHRDIKPGNVMLHGAQGRVVAKVVDFGIARLTQERDVTLTAPATAIGTAAYMSPEQATGEPLTPASDIYSLGCLLVALLTGRPPYTAEHPLAVLQQHVLSTPPPPSARQPDVPPGVDALAAQLMRRDPADRPDVATVARMCAAILDRGPVADLPRLPASEQRHDTATTLLPVAVEPTRSPRTPVEPSDPGSPVEPPTAPASRPRSSRIVAVLLVLVLLAVLAVGALMLLDRRAGEPAGTPSPAMSSSAAPSASGRGSSAGAPSSRAATPTPPESASAPASPTQTASTGPAVPTGAPSRSGGEAPSGSAPSGGAPSGGAPSGGAPSGGAPSGPASTP